MEKTEKGVIHVFLNLTRNLPQFQTQKNVKMWIFVDDKLLFLLDYLVRMTSSTKTGVFFLCTPFSFI